MNNNNTLEKQIIAAMFGTTILFIMIAALLGSFWLMVKAFIIVVGLI